MICRNSISVYLHFMPESRVLSEDNSDYPGIHHSERIVREIRKPNGDKEPSSSRDLPLFTKWASCREPGRPKGMSGPGWKVRQLNRFRNGSALSMKSLLTWRATRPKRLAKRCPILRRGGLSSMERTIIQWKAGIRA